MVWLHPLTRGTMRFRDGLFRHLTAKYVHGRDARATAEGFKPTAGFYLVWGVIGRARV